MRTLVTKMWRYFYIYLPFTGIIFSCGERQIGITPPSFEYVSENVILFKDVCNVYAIKQGESALLVDFGAGKIINHLSELGISSIDWVLHTHNHRDQCQGDNKLFGSDTKIAIPAKEADSMTDVENFWKQSNLLYDLYAFKPDFKTPWYSINADHLLNGGEVFTWNGLNIEVIDSPGHTEGSLSFLVNIDGKKFAFTGDLIHSPGKVWDFSSLQRRYNDNSEDGAIETIESLENILTKNPDILFPSHGIAIRNPRTAVDVLAANLEEAVDLLSIRRGSIPRPPRTEQTVNPVQILPHLWWKNTSYFLITDDGKTLMYDFAGSLRGNLAGEWDIEFLKQNANLKSIEIVLPSHYHDDHIAGFNILKEKYGTQVWCHEYLVDVLENPRSYNIPCLIDESIIVDRVLKENETFTWEGYTFEVFHYPGQTEYHQGMSGEIDGKKVLFTGDSNVGIGGRTLRGENFNCRNYCRLEDDEGYTLCAKIAAEKRPNLILTAHNGAIEVTDQKLQDFLDWAGKLKPTLTKVIAQPDANIGTDPNWVHMYPFHVITTPGEKIDVEVRVRNHLSQNSEAQIEIHAPEEWKVSPKQRTISAIAKQTSRAKFTITIPEDADPEGVTVLTSNVVFAGRDWGEIGEMVIDHGFKRPPSLIPWKRPIEDMP